MKGTVEYYESEKIFHGHIPFVMGTRLDLVAVGQEREMMEDVWSQISLASGMIDGMLNRFDRNSEVSRLNAAASICHQGISGELSAILELCEDYKQRTEGLFDIACGEMDKIHFDAESGLSLCGATLDFGGFAKGYFLKQCRDIFERQQVQNLFLDFGDSSIMALGHHPHGNCWKVSVMNSFTRLPLAELELRNQTLSTSGNTPSYSGHIVNPQTGEHNTDRKMVTVISGDPLDAEVLSTVLMIASEQQRENISKAFPGTEYRIYNL